MNEGGFEESLKHDPSLKMTNKYSSRHYAHDGCVSTKNRLRNWRFLKPLISLLITLSGGVDQIQIQNFLLWQGILVSYWIIFGLCRPLLVGIPIES